MKKAISLFVLALLILTSLAGCSATDEKSEEEMREEIRAELEAETQMKEELEAEVRAELEAEQREKEEIKKLSHEELISKQAEYEGKFRELLGGIPGDEGQIGGLYTADITQFHHYKDNSEFREYVDMLFALGYGIEQAEGYYYLYVGEPKNYADGEVQTGSGNQESPSQPTQGNQLLEIYETNKEYKLDLNRGQELDTFSVKLSKHSEGYTDPWHYAN